MMLPKHSQNRKIDFKYLNLLFHIGKSTLQMSCVTNFRIQNFVQMVMLQGRDVSYIILMFLNIFFKLIQNMCNQKETFQRTKTMKFTLRCGVFNQFSYFNASKQLLLNLFSRFMFDSSFIFSIIFQFIQLSFSEQLDIMFFIPHALLDFLNKLQLILIFSFLLLPN